MKHVVILGFSTLLFDVLREHLVSHVAARAYKVPADPKVLTPEFPPQFPKVAEQMVRGLAFDRLHYSARGQGRRHVQKQMNVVWSHMPADDFDPIRTTNLSHEFPHTQNDVSHQDRFAVFGYEDEVIVKQKARV